MPERDIIDLLLEDHDEFRELFTRLETAPAAEREDLLHYAVARLANHEAAEEVVVHPVLRDDVPGGADLAADLLAEEAVGERVLAEIQHLDADDQAFISGIARLRKEVLGHAEHEERDEFPRIREHVDAQTRREMAERFERLQRVGPTRPHALTPQSPALRAVVGPLVGMFDRARDAVRDAQEG